MLTTSRIRLAACTMALNEAGMPRIGNHAKAVRSGCVTGMLRVPQCVRLPYLSCPGTVRKTPLGPGNQCAG
jgi:hypothetical protein